MLVCAAWDVHLVPGCCLCCQDPGSPWPFPQCPREVTERLLHVWVHFFFHVIWAQADVLWTKVMASGDFLG